MTNHHRNSVTDPPLCVDGEAETKRLIGNKYMAKLLVAGDRAGSSSDSSNGLIHF